MAISNQAIWEVESGGSDTNGGGFVFGTAGTDFSQQLTAQIAVTNAVAVGSTTITSATANFSSVDVGNIIYLAGGTGSLTASWYQVITVVNSTTITVDRTVATGTGITLNLGGAFATIQTGLNQLVTDGNILYVKGATYSISSTLTIPNASGTLFIRVIGYTSNRFDLGKPTISQTAAADVLHLAQGTSIENFILDGTSTALIGILVNALYCKISNSKIMNCTTGAISNSSSDLVLYSCEVTLCGGTYAIAAGSEANFAYLYVHNNTGGGANLTGGSCAIVGCIFANNGAIGILDGADNSITDCLFYGNGSDGIQGTIFSMVIPTIMRNNIFAKNSGYGINGPNYSSITLLNFPWIQNNGFWSNTIAPVNFITLDSTNIQISGTSPTNDPFVNDAAGNYALNNVAGAGRLFRNAGFAGVYSGLPTSTGHADIGPFQHLDIGSNSTFVMA